MKIRVASPPEAGRANRDLVDVLEGALGGTVRLVGGMHSRHKVFEIPGQDVATATRKLGLGG